MPYTRIQSEDAVFINEGTVGIGAVREVHTDHIIVYIERFGDQRISADEISAVHDGKVVLAFDKLPDDVREAVLHAHDAEDNADGNWPPDD
ncbi:hypothetical protein [Granulosicoccus antarcticus]|uniref:Uncharacterized protein n=1 Tax=Granulosicoccus antarcticus IMCC3135 TaxID=1192854 RepID=A0A2Z2NSN4_9GAMM|nr:hypothetical protein [Granulosicoccus antarcticus]ASJ73525.1 hypothetical protein IMCC3135_17215 [Granulosicoccus antarcticus IMCC3135]